MRYLPAFVLGFFLAGCGIARQQELAAQQAALQQQSITVMKECNEKYAPDNPKIAVIRAQCINNGLVILQPTMPYPDLLMVLMADHVAIAEQIQTGRITMAQGSALIAQKWSALTAEEQRRNLANRSVTAAEESASAATAAAWRAASPRTCNYGSGTVRCF